MPSLPNGSPSPRARSERHRTARFRRNASYLFGGTFGPAAGTDGTERAGASGFIAQRSQVQVLPRCLQIPELGGLAFHDHHLTFESRRSCTSLRGVERPSGSPSGGAGRSARWGRRRSARATGSRRPRLREQDGGDMARALVLRGVGPSSEGQHRSRLSRLISRPPCGVGASLGVRECWGVSRPRTDPLGPRQECARSLVCERTEIDSSIVRHFRSTAIGIVGSCITTIPCSSLRT